MSLVVRLSKSCYHALGEEHCLVSLGVGFTICRQFRSDLCLDLQAVLLDVEEWATHNVSCFEARMSWKIRKAMTMWTRNSVAEHLEVAERSLSLRRHISSGFWASCQNMDLERP